MTVYEYTNDLCSKETYYTDSIGSSYQYFKSYRYDHNELALSYLINADKWLFVAGYYFYDDNGNLILEYGEQIAEVQAYLGFCNRYEYY